MSKLVWFLVISLSLGMALTLGCYIPAPQEKTQTVIPAGGFLTLEIDVAGDEVVEGSWKADAGILGSYTSPTDVRFAWSLSSGEHNFSLNRASVPGTYVFRFENSGSTPGKLVFQYRAKKTSSP